MRAAIYARVSKDDEGKSDSVPVQLAECRAFAARQGLTVVADFSDDGISGYARGNRPGFLSLMQAVAAREFDVILFRDVDRLARGPDLPVICREVEFAQVILLGDQRLELCTNYRLFRVAFVQAIDFGLDGIRAIVVTGKITGRPD